VCPLRYRRHLTTAPFAKRTSPRACGSLSASAWVVGESAEGTKPPSACALLHAGFPPLPQPLHAVALHGFAKDRYAIKRSPFAGCWCSGSLIVPRPLVVPLRRCRLRRLLCVPVFNIKASYAKRKRRKTPALRVRIRGLYVLRPSGKYRHTSQSQIPSPAVRGSKTGLVLRRPFAFCCMVVPVYVLSCCGRFAAYVGGAFPLTPPIPPAAK